MVLYALNQRRICIHFCGAPAIFPLRPCGGVFRQIRAQKGRWKPAKTGTILIRDTRDKREFIMADNGGSIGVLGVIVGALLVIVVGGAVLYATGVLGPKNSVTIQMPKVK